MKKSNILVVVILFSFLGAWLFLGKEQEETKKENVEEIERQSPSVVTSVFDSKEKSITLDYFGSVYLGKSYNFNSERSDEITVFVKKGQLVDKGDKLFGYKNKKLLSERQALLAERARLRVEQKGLEKLQTQNLSSEVEYKRVLEDIARLNSNLVSIEEDIKNATQKAPESGIVEEVYIQSDQYVGNGQDIMLLQANENKVSAFIDVSDFPEINVGDHITFVSADKVLDGVVDFKSSNIDRDNSGQVLFAMEEPINLPNGYPGKVIIDIAQKQVLTIPIDAALLKEGKLGVYHIVEGKAVFQPINVIKTQKNNLVVESFSGSPEIVVLGQYLIDDSGKVEVKEQ